MGESPGPTGSRTTRESRTRPSATRSGYELLEGLSREGWTVTVTPAEFGHYPAGHLMFSARRDGDALDRPPLAVYGRSANEEAPRLVELCREAMGQAA